jgi:hypothetical protein
MPSMFYTKPFITIPSVFDFNSIINDEPVYPHRLGEIHIPTFAL